MNNIKAFILAAGLGERLRPITDHLPKPLLPILGRPVVDMVLENLSALPLDGIGMNIHYKAGMLRDWVSESAWADRITLFHEDPILGTGGGFRNASSMLSRSDFLVHNADILSDIDLRDLLAHHRSSGNLATLAVHDLEKFNNVWIDQEDLLRRVGAAPSDMRRGLRVRAFTGIAVYSPDFLSYLSEGPSTVVDAWLRAASSGRRVGTLDVSGCSWSDIGTPGAYACAVFNRLKEEGETIFVHSSVNCAEVGFGGSAVIEERCEFDGRATVRNCLLMPGARLPDDAVIENSIEGPGYSLSIGECQTIPSSLTSSLISAFLGEEDNLGITLIGNGGSDRRYYRIRGSNKTAVLMESPGADPDFNRHVIYTRFLRKYAIPVPELIDLEGGRPDSTGLQKRGVNQALFEDLGDTSLYSWLKCRRDGERTERLYLRIMDVISSLHTTVTRHVPECPLLKMRVFDYEHLRWETSYFLDRFVTGLIGLSVRDPESLERELDRLARRVDSYRKAVIHRDLQSQNIMVTEGDQPRVIDFQGARLGPPAYDIASFLWDPYSPMEEEMRERLLSYYIDKGLPEGMGREAFVETVLPCRLQRHMQALGAYGFLAKEKGKRYFLRHVPQALRYLSAETRQAGGDYPALESLVREICVKYDL